MNTSTETNSISPSEKIGKKNISPAEIFKTVSLIVFAELMLLPFGMSRMDLFNAEQTAVLFYPFTVLQSGAIEKGLNFLYINCFALFLIPVACIVIFISFFQKKINRKITYLCTLIPITLYISAAIAGMIIHANTARWFYTLDIRVYLAFFTAVLFHFFLIAHGIMSIKMQNTAYVQYEQLLKEEKQKERALQKKTAEKIKKTSGCCWEPLIGADEEVVIPGIGGNPPQVVSRREICAIIQPRIEEIFAMVRQKLPEQVKKQRLSGSVILAGGGALLPGIAELASKEFKTDNVRIAQPANYGGPVETYRSPEFSTVIGLLTAETNRVRHSGESAKKHGKGGENDKGSVLRSIGGWFKEFF